MISILTDQDGKRCYGLGDKLILFEDGFALELLNSLRLEGISCAPVPIFCEHCSMWLTEFTDCGCEIYFCHCIAFQPEIPPLTQERWYSFRARARGLFQLYRRELSLIRSFFTDAQISEEELLNCLRRWGVPIHPIYCLQQLPPKWISLIRAESQCIIEAIRDRQS